MDQQKSPQRKDTIRRAKSESDSQFHGGGGGGGGEGQRSSSIPTDDSSHANNNNSSIAIGIDLGTTSSVAGCYRNGKFEIIKSQRGETFLPSFVYFNNDGSTLVGREAKKLAIVEAQHIMFNTKRLIGMNFEDGQKQKEKYRWPFDLFEERNQPHIRLRNNLYAPQDNSAHVLSQLKKNAEAQLGHEVKYAVISVPAAFNNNQRQSTLEAGQKAGLKILRLVNEPTASAISHCIQHHLDDDDDDDQSEDGPGQNILVFDLGGGSFDVSVCHLKGPNIFVIATGGDARFGGIDFDMTLLTHCLHEWEDRNGLTVPIDLTDMGAQEKATGLGNIKKLRGGCEHAKILLSENGAEESAEIFVENFHAGRDLRQTIGRKEFVRLNEKLFEKCITVMEDVREESGLAWTDLDAILLVGGSTKMPAIEQMIRQRYESGPIFKYEKDQGVVFGAAVVAQILNPDVHNKSTQNLWGVGEKRMKIIEVSDITPLSLGVRKNDGDMVMVIPKHTRLPTTVNKIWVTEQDNQTSITFQIYQGESPNLKENWLLDKFTIYNIPSAPKATEKIHVRMTVDENGILRTVASSDSDRNLKKSVSIIRRSSVMNF